MLDKKDNIRYIPPMHLNFLTPIYDIGCTLMGLGGRFRNAIINRLGIAGTEKVLDAGCGTGALLMALKGRYPDIVAEGLDPDEIALEIAKKKSGRKGLDIKWHLGFMEKMPFDDGSFDIVVSTLALHHVNPEKKLPALMECRRVLRPSGRMVLVDVSPDDTGLFGRAIYKVLSMFEHLMKVDQIMAMMKEAGFSEVRNMESYRNGVTFIEGRKAGSSI